jgi:hypothetical protein
MTNNVDLFKLKPSYHAMVSLFQWLLGRRFSGQLCTSFCQWRISGDPFPTPFAKPPGKGLSSPIVNVWWSLLNAVVGYVLLKTWVRFLPDDNLSMIIFFVGVCGYEPYAC